MTALYLGLMSGTSMDGVDAALCEFVHERFTGVVDSHRVSYSDAVRRQLLRLQSGAGGLSLREYAALDQAVANAFAEAALPLCQGQRVSAIGSHGQTVFHDGSGLRNSLQIGNPSLIAARTGVPVVADFRRADLALGGQGAPLVPAFHQAVFGHSEEARCIVNIGGIANVTLLDPGAAQPVRGWDTGPGNGLMDEWIALRQNQSYDAGGAWAASGALCMDMLHVLLSDEYFRKAPPKSTGRDYFNVAWMRDRYSLLGQYPAEDVQRTLCELTAQSIADAVLEHAATAPRVFICGGGTKNELLMARLQALLEDRSVESTAALHLAPDLVEAAAFAWLAMRRLKKLPGNLPAVTGARRETVLGGIYRP